MVPAYLIATLQMQGHKITVARRAIIEILCARKVIPKKPYPPAQLYSANQILASLHRQNLKVNKTTVYRELEFLIRQGAVMEISTGREKMYEILDTFEHHHHLICRKCDKIEHVTIPDDLKQIEQKIARQNKFEILSHMLEFFGLCQKCAK